MHCDMAARSLLLLGHTYCATTATCCLGVLTTDTETPVGTETTVKADLLQALKVLTVLQKCNVSFLFVLQRCHISPRTFESSWLDNSCPFLPSIQSFCLLRNQAGILN